MEQSTPLDYSGEPQDRMDASRNARSIDDIPLASAGPDSDEL